MSWALFLLTSASVFVAGGTQPAEQKVSEQYLAEVRKTVEQLTRDLELFQGTVIDELSGKQQRDLYRQADAVLDESAAFQQSLKTGGSRDELYRRFDQMDAKLHALIEAVRALGTGQRALQRAATYVQAADDQLHFALSAGDTSEARTRQVVERQARALTAAAHELKQAASYALGGVPGRGALVGDVTKLAEAAEAFQKGLGGPADRKGMQESFAEVNAAWERVIQGLNGLPPHENVYLLRSAFRVDRFHERLYRLLGLKGDRPQLSIRT
jgi:hypothetical protein